MEEIRNAGLLLLQLKDVKYAREDKNLNVICSTQETKQPKVVTPRKNGGGMTQKIQLEDLRQYFDMPIVEVAKRFGICTTLLKKICRKSGIRRWPHRQIRSISKSIDGLRTARQAATSAASSQRYDKQIAELEARLQDVIENPNGAGKSRSRTPGHDVMWDNGTDKKETKRGRFKRSRSSSTDNSVSGEGYESVASPKKSKLDLVKEEIKIVKHTDANPGSKCESPASGYGRVMSLSTLLCT